MRMREIARVPFGASWNRSYPRSTNRRCASACANAGASVSNLPVLRSSSATCRVVAIAISDTAVAVLARATPMLAAQEVGLLSLSCRYHLVVLKLLVAAGRSHPCPATMRGQARPSRMVGKSVNTMHMDKCGKIPNCSLSDEGQIDYDRCAGSESGR